MRLYKRTLLIFVLLLNYCATALSQDNIIGTIKDSTGSPVQYATITLCSDSIGTKGILSYCISNSSGAFQLKKKDSDVCWLIIKCLGFETYRIKYSDTSEQVFDITLKDSSKTISEVTIKGRYTGVKNYVDSIVFDIEHFKTGAEETVGDVLRRLPGIEVDNAAGKVSYSGRNLDKILIDGQDVAATGSNMVINNLPASVMLGAEIIKNYKEGSIVDQFKGNDKTALNIKTNSKTKLSGTISAGGGFMDKFEIKPSLFAVKESFSFSSLSSLNNTGKPMFSIEDYLGNFANIEDMLAEGDGITRLSDEENKLLTPPENVYKNKSFASAFNMIFTPSSRIKIKGNIVLNKSIMQSGFHNYDEYYESGLLANNKLESLANDKYESFSLRARWRPCDMIEVNSSTLLGFSNYSTKEKLEQTTEKLLEVSQCDIMRKYFLKQSLALNMGKNKNMLFVFADMSLSNRNNPIDIKSDSIILPIDYDLTNKMYQYNANLKKKYSKFTFEIGNSYKFRSIILKNSIRCIYAKDVLRYNNNSSSETNTNSDYTCWDLITRISKKDGLMRFSLGGILSYMKYDANIDKFPKDNLKCIFSPEGNIRIVFSPKHEMGISASYVYTPKDIRYMVDYSMVSGYDKINGNSSIRNPYVNRFNVSFNYRLFNMYNNLLLFIVGSYSKDNNSVLQNVNQEGIASNINYSDGGKQQNMYMKVAVSKGINVIPLDLKLNISLSKQIGNSMINFDAFDIINKSLSTNAIIATRFKFFLNAEMSGKYNRYSTITYKNSTNDMTEYSLQTKLLYAYKQLKGNIYICYNHGTNKYGLHKNTDIGFSTSYNVKKISIKLSGENILHLHNYEWINTMTSNVFTSTSIFRKVPGNLLFSIAYKL